ncbi:MAG: hypothetical protein Q8L14_31130 [Myxococcales bacterium]|nr:hypothetical protein [Myxococcales bacterium]
MTPCDRALERFLELTNTSLEAHVSDRAVTLHCLSAHAPEFFEAHHLGPKLDAALEGLAALPSTFPADLPWEVVMARLDAHYFRALYGLENPPLPSADVRAAVAKVTEQSVLAGWLLAELAGALGVEFEIPDPSALTGMERTYWRTHQILLWTSYLRDPLETEGADVALNELARSLPLRLACGEIDPAAEIIFCLQAGGRVVEPEFLERLVAHQQADGRFTESDSDDAREQAHCTAVCLIALAGRRSGEAGAAERLAQQ